METLKLILLLLAIYLGLPLLIVWANDKIFHRFPSKAKIEEYSRRFKERLLNPNFAAVEAHFKRPVPEELKKLYADKNEILRGDFEVQTKSRQNTDDCWYIAFYNPADEENLVDVWQDCKQYFAFADDGCGNSYLIDPLVNQSEVLFHDHETGEFTRLGVNLVEFLSAPRKQPKA